jgi:hypothetical protein
MIIYSNFLLPHFIFAPIIMEMDRVSLKSGPEPILDHSDRGSESCLPQDPLFLSRGGGTPIYVLFIIIAHYVAILTPCIFSSSWFIWFKGHCRPFEDFTVLLFMRAGVVLCKSFCVMLRYVVYFRSYLLLFFVWRAMFISVVFRAISRTLSHVYSVPSPLRGLFHQI